MAPWVLYFVSFGIIERWKEKWLQQKFQEAAPLKGNKQILLLIRICKKLKELALIRCDHCLGWGHTGDNHASNREIKKMEELQGI